MNRFEKSKEVFNKLFGELPDSNTEIDHELMEILRRFIFGDVFHSSDEIDMKEIRLLCTCIIA